MVDLLHPPDIQLQVRTAGSQRVQAAFSAPDQEAAQVGLGVVAGGALESGQVGGYCELQLITIGASPQPDETCPVLAEVGERAPADDETVPRCARS